MNITHKMPILLSTIMLVMGLLYACPDADSEDSTPSPPRLKAEDIIYDKDSIAQGTVGRATPSSTTITDFSILKFSLKPISTYTGTQIPPTINEENGIIITTATTTAGSYRVTITPDGSTFSGPLTVDFYVTIKANDINDLDTKLKQAVTDYGLTGDFNYIDTSAVTDLSWFFIPGWTPGGDKSNPDRTYFTNFNGDISKWDVSSVTDFEVMFGNATEFNQDISGWTVSKGTNFNGMFNSAAKFNQDISGWDVSSGTNFSSMFSGATAFNYNIGGWTVSAGKDFSSMFSGATAFNQNIGGWTVTAGTNFARMFQGATAFNQDISEWTVTAGTNFTKMFEGAAAFDQDLSEWTVDSTDLTTDMFKDSGMTTLPSWYQP